MKKNTQIRQLKSYFSITLLALFSQLILSQEITISSDVNAVEENSSITITATADASASSDIKIPLAFSGTANLNSDYQVVFPSIGEETAILDFVAGQDYGDMRIHQDGRIFFLKNNTLRVYDISTTILTTYNLSNSYDQLELVGDIIYTRNSNTNREIYKIDVSDLDNIAETIYIQLASSIGFRDQFGMVGSTIVYNTYNETLSNDETFKKVEGADPERISIDWCCGKPLLLNSRIYRIVDRNIHELVNGEYKYRPFEGFKIDVNSAFVYNNEFYVRSLLSNDSAYTVTKIDISGSFENDAAITTDDLTDLPISEDSDIKNFTIDPSNGNLFTQNVNTSNEISVSSYQFYPQLKIASGETAGSITLNGNDDTIPEIDETIILTPGTPSAGSLADSSAITYNLLDNDDDAVVTFAFSATSIEENSSNTVTLTATADPATGADITIPFTMGGTAESSEYVVSASQIVIPSGTKSGSVTISTEGLDDATIEPIETIIFTIGTLTNATTAVSDLTLDLASEDNPVVNSLVADASSFDEATPFIISATLNQASSKDVTIPVILSGTAANKKDYTITFESLGEETVIAELASNYGEMRIHDDGRLIFLKDYSLRIYEPSSNIWIVKELSNSFGNSDYGMQIINNILYAAQSQKIYKIDLSDLNNITETVYIEFAAGHQLDGGFSAEGDNIVYNIYDSNLNNNNRKVYKKTGSAEPELIWEGGECCYTPVLLDDKVYQINENDIRQIVDGVYSDRVNLGINIDRHQSVKYNGNIYVKANSSVTTFDIAKLTLPVSWASDAENMPNVTYESLPTSEDSQSTSFDIDPNTGNPFLVNYSNSNLFSVSSYQISPQIKITAGQTSGALTVNPIEDGVFEEEETIIFTLGTPTNATLGAAAEAYTVNLQNFDTASEVTFAFSSESIEENSSNTVTLTATTSPVSGADITIPFTLTGTATETEEYVVSNTQIVIPSGSISASITISTVGLDDTDIEVLETIIFNIDSIDNAITAATALTLNLLSDDNPEITSITPDDSSFDETTSLTITATIDQASSKDASIPLLLSGTAINNSDYTFTFPSQGQGTLITNLDSDFGKLQVHQDGRIFFLRNTNLTVFNPANSSITSYALTNNYEQNLLLNNIIYARNNNTQSIYKIDVSNLDNITETIYVDLLTNNYFQDQFSIEGDTLVYTIYNSNTEQHETYKKENESSPVKVSTTNFCCGDSLLLNGRIFKLDNNNLHELVNGEHQYRNFDGFNIQANSAFVYNNEVYVKSKLSDATLYSISKMDISGTSETNLALTSANLTALAITEESTIDDFAINPSNGNVVLQNIAADNSLSISSYQFSPEISIPAGQTSGTFTINPIDDKSYEVDETIVFALGSPNNTALANDVSGFTITLEDNDTLPEVNFALSSESIEENSSNTVTLTATSSEVSGAEIKIPFTLSGTAESSEYVVSGTEIIIPSGSSSASVTVSTDNLDDNNVEISETIIFTIGTIVNATAAADTSITLELISDDNPNSTLIANNTSMAENGTASITLTLDTPTSEDVIVPLILTGTADFNIDYSTNFASEGKEKFIIDLGDNNYNSFNALDDGRFMFLRYNEIYILDPTTNTREVFMINDGNDGFNHFTVSNNVVYLFQNQKIDKISVVDFVSGNGAVTTTPILTSASFGQNDYYQLDNITAEGDTFLYQLRDWPSGYKVYKKDGDNAPELLYEGEESAQRLLLFNDRVYRFNGSTVSELYNQEYTNEIQYSNTNFYQLKAYNKQVYALVEDNNVRKVVKLSLETDIINSSTSGTLTEIPYALSDEIDFIYDFSFNTAGNLLFNNRLVENNTTSYAMYSYQLSPEIFIAAGASSGAFTFNAVNDISYEEDETIIVTPGTLENTTITSEDLILTIVDNDNPPEITFELSSESIIENSEMSVTLTAISDIPSGKEITIPFSLSGTALSDEYSVDAVEIVIPGNSTSKSITISTFEKNDDEVEPIETIVFDIDTANIVNATSATESVTLNLISEDLTAVTSLTIDKTQITEGAAAVISAGIETPTGLDVYVPINFTGTAANEIDYDSDFIAKGEEKLLNQLPNSYRSFDIYPDGKYIFLNQNEQKIEVYNPISDSFDSASLNNQNSGYFDEMQVHGNDIYIRSNNGIYTVDITNISAGSIQLTELINDDSGLYLESFTVENGNLLYIAKSYNNNNTIVSILRADETTPTNLLSTAECCFKPVLLNDKIYLLDNWRFFQVINNELVNEKEYAGNSNDNSIQKDQMPIKAHNGNVYVIKSEDTSLNTLNLETGKLTKANYTPSSDINYISSFAFSSEGNLLMLNNYSNTSKWGVFNYLQTLQIKIIAGEVNGSVIINTIDDASYEPSETIIANLGTPINATLTADIAAVEVEVLDNDEQPVLTLAFSKAQIVENSSEEVQLNATVSVVSGFDTSVTFSALTGTATLVDEYVVIDANNSDDVLKIVIPAGQESGSLSISTQGLDDNDVEILETINFTLSQIENATATSGQEVLLLESDDDPNLMSIAAAKTVFAEHESTNITATLDLPASRDVFVPLTLAGNALYDIDYGMNYATKGEEYVLQEFESGIVDFGYLADGRLVVLVNNGELNIYELDGTINVISLYVGSNNYAGSKLLVNGTNVFLINYRQISRLDMTSMELSYVSELSGDDSHVEGAANFVNGKLYYIIRSNNIHTLYSKIDGVPQVNIAIFDNNDYYEGIAVNENEEIFVYNSDRIFKLDENNELKTIFERNYDDEGQHSDFKFFGNKLYAKRYDNTSQKTKISIFNESSSSFKDVDISVTANTTIVDYAMNSQGRLVLLNQQENGSYKINAYKATPEIIIPAGSTSANLVVYGIEDDLNAPGEEEDETIILGFLEPVNATLLSDTEIVDITLTLLNNQISVIEDTDAIINVPALSSSSIAWGDFDRDGDQDMAVMGVSLSEGVITRLYENQAGIFVNSKPGLFDPRYEGDLIWVDYNKDGYIDLIVSGLDVNDQPRTTIYENIDGNTFTPSVELSLPNIFNTSMDSGDLDNDGDIDFVMNGLDENNQWKKYIYSRQGSKLELEEDYNGQFNSQGIENGVVKIVDNGFDGDLDIFMVGADNSKIQNNTFIQNNTIDYSELNNFDNPSMALFGNFFYYMGSNGDTYQLNRRSLGEITTSFEEVIDASTNENIPGLIKGDIAIADYNNDGFEDMLLTGINETAEYVTRLYDGIEGSGFILNTEIDLIGLGNSTAKWVDFDTDGDLDLFITGTGDNGEVAKLYRTDLLNKSNTAAQTTSNLIMENLGNGKVKLSWDAPEDDFSSSLGYVLRLGVSAGGTELSNTESNLETGQRFITKSPVVYTNSFETLLSPGVYFWSVQSVDDGLKGSVFSEESSFILTYEWKLLNQGGIIDRAINAFGEPIVKLTDIDSDNDMDLVYGSRQNDNDVQIFTLGDKNFKIFGQLQSSRNITDLKFLEFNDDGTQDILVNSWENSNNNSFKLYNSVTDGPPQEVFSANGLFEAKIELIDINNDGIKEIVHIGRTSETASSTIKMFVYEKSGNSLKETPIDISEQVAGLKEGAYAFGNFDNDDDIDFAITGRSNAGLQNKAYFNETVYTETIAPIYNYEEAIAFSGAINSTLDFIDFDADGDLDMVITGTGLSGDMFKVLSNNGLTGTDLKFAEVLDTGLTPIRNAKVDFGDYNSDGYPDILYSGTVSSIGKVTKLVEYDPNEKTYIDSDFDLSGIVNASIAFGDVDGDNDLDFTIAGESNSNEGVNLIKTYLNVRNESAEVQNDAAKSGLSVRKSNDDPVFVINTKPTKPEGLNAEVGVFNSETGTYPFKLSWQAAFDDFTPAKGLTYAIKVGTTAGGDDIMKMNARDNGYRLSAGKGNVEHKTEWMLNLPNNTYYYSVQAIDAAYSGSELSETKSFNNTSLSVKEYGAINIMVYPNPVNNSFVNIVSPLNGTKKILLYDLQGRTIISKYINEDKLDIGIVSPGVYLLKVIIDGKQKVTKLLVN